MMSQNLRLRKKAHLVLKFLIQDTTHCEAKCDSCTVDSHLYAAVYPGVAQRYASSRRQRGG